MYPEDNSSGKKKRLSTPLMGLVLCFSLILSYIESLVPIPIGIPGIKLGLPNLAVVLLLFAASPLDAIIINILRIILSGFMFGNLYSIIYSAAGGILSFLSMYFLKRTGLFSIHGVSIAGGFFHNMGQLAVAFYVLKSRGLFYYLPLLAIGGVITGFVIGIVSRIMLPVFIKVNQNDSLR